MTIYKKSIAICISGVFLLILFGCSSQNNSNPMDITDAEEKLPTDYHLIDNNVEFDFTLELPKNLIQNNILAGNVLGLEYTNQEKAKKILGQNKKIVESYTVPADEYSPEEYSYYFDNGSFLNAGGSSLVYKSDKANYYTDVFAKIKGESKSDFAFADTVKCLEDVKQALISIGIDTTFSFSCYSLSYEQAQEWEEHYAKDGTNDTKAYKTDWSDKDNVYLVSAYQTYQDIPIYHELMAFNQNMAFDNAYNAPVQVIYGKDGVESLLVTTQYNIQQTSDKYQLLPFEKITQTVRAKLKNLLTQENFLVDRAKLFMRVSLDETQKYTMSPMWYFETIAETENHEESRRIVILVNAITGEEITVSGHAMAG